MKFSGIITALLLLVVMACTAQTTAKSEEKPAVVASDELVWYTDFAQVQAASAAANKPIFGFFTGSDWCGWCHKLQRDVFAKPAFKTWAKENVILFEIDFPRRKQLSTELTQQNQGLQQAFQVRGYPTVWIFKAEADAANANINLKAYGSLGYPAGSEQGKEEVKFLTDANAILSNGQN
jgi:thioredoxin-related protein